MRLFNKKHRPVGPDEMSAVINFPSPLAEVHPALLCSIKDPACKRRIGSLMRSGGILFDFLFTYFFVVPE